MITIDQILIKFLFGVMIALAVYLVRIGFKK